MSEPIQPALTPEEWTAWANTDDANGLGYGRYELHHQPSIMTHEVRQYSDGISCVGDASDEEFSPDQQDRHALAALCLYGQLYGPTHEHLALLRYLNEGHDLEPDEESGFIDRALTRKQADCLALLVEIVAALLPPTP